MTAFALILGAAALGGVLAVALRLPALVGFLVTGFILSAAGIDEPPGLETAAQAGVTVLLFAIGLKFNATTLLRREVWLPGSTHLAATTLLTAGLLGLLGTAGISLAGALDGTTLALVAVTLAFSSTVLAVKVLEEQSLDLSLVGRTAIGVLVVQDLVAVVLIAVTHGSAPSLWALSLLALVPARHAVHLLRPALDKPELRPVIGLALAFGPGYALFEAVGLKGDLGALLVGILVGTQPGAGTLARSLMAPKELLLIGFFMSIGFSGHPGMAGLLVAAALLALVPLKLIGFAWLLGHCGFRRRTAVLTATLLASYSEFCLIVAATLVPEPLPSSWLATLACAVAGSMVLGSVLSAHRERVVELFGRFVPERPEQRLHHEDRPIDVGDAEAVVLGMGRIGSGAYDQLRDHYGLRVLGVEVDSDRIERLRARGRHVVEGDATDPEFWQRLTGTEARITVLAMPFHGHNLQALDLLEAYGYTGTVAMVASRDHDLKDGLERGAHTGFQLYAGAGTELANRAALEAGLGPTR